MAQVAKANRIAAAYGELKKFIENSSYTRIIKVSNKIIGEDVKQKEAWLCKVVALIQTDQFKDAANTINKAPNKMEMMFELAYCKYRMNDVLGALEIINSAPDKNTPRSRELLAQIYYRLEQFEPCYGTYKEILRSTEDDYDMERSTNMRAVQAQRTLLKQCELPDAPKTDSSYEEWYNSGCAALASSDLGEAELRLGKSLQKCAEFLKEEDATKEEIDQEQAIIKTQQAYVLQMQGREKEALALYNSVLQTKISDPVLQALLHNNVSATSQRELSVFDVKKKLKTTQVADLVNKLTLHQRNLLSLNNCIIYYLSQQSLQEDKNLLEECQSLLENSTALSSIKLNAMLVMCASLAKAGKIDEAVEKLSDWAKKNSEDIMMTSLAITQLRLMKSDVTSAISTLSSLPPHLKFKPGVVGALVTLLNNRKLRESVTKLLDEAVKYHSKNKESDLSALEKLLRRASDLQMKEGCPEAAAAALEQLRISSPQTNDACVASLINCYSQFDKSKAMELSRSLPDLKTDDLDMDHLESSLGPKYFQKPKENTGAKAETTAAPSVRSKPRKKKKRKTILPKNYVEGVTPDPERWLPRWQRKTGAKRRKDRKRDKDVGRGTQGGTGDAADKYDITKNPNQNKSNTSSHHKSGHQGPRRNMPKKKAGKKK